MKPATTTPFAEVKDSIRAAAAQASRRTADQRLGRRSCEKTYPVVYAVGYRAADDATSPTDEPATRDRRHRPPTTDP